MAKYFSVTLNWGHTPDFYHAECHRPFPTEEVACVYAEMALAGLVGSAEANGSPSNTFHGRVFQEPGHSWVKDLLAVRG